MILEFRNRLQKEFLNRVKSNPRYSMRAFARFLQIDAATLSQYLSGKRKLTTKKVRELSYRLDLSPDEVDQYLNTITKSQKASSLDWKKDNQDLSLDVFQLIADWYHYAIFELTTLEDFINKPSWIASRLGISVTEVRLAIDRLQRLGLIVKDANGNLKQGSSNLSTTKNLFTATAFRKLQSQVLEMGLKALTEIPMEYRDQSSMTMAISSTQLGMAKSKIMQFRRELCDLLQKDKNGRDSVYQLGISFYPLTQITEIKK